MASIERTAYPQFKPSLTAAELSTLYYPTEEERCFVTEHARGVVQQLTLLTLLKCHQHLGYLPALPAVPDQIRTYLCQQLSLLPLPYESVDAERTLSRYRQLIRTYLDIQPFTNGGPKVVETVVEQAAYTMSDPADLINVAIEHLIQQRFELPAFSTLDRLVSHVRHQVHQALYAQIAGPLSPPQQARLEALKVFNFLVGIRHLTVVPILSDELLRCFDGSDFSGEEIITSKQPITVYLRLPESQLLALAPVIRLLFQSLINTCTDTYDNRPGRTAEEKGCYPVLFLIDEAGRAAIPKLYEYATTVVGRQVSLWIAMQSIVQLEAIYGWAHAQELLENLDTKIFYRQGHVTAKYLEEELDKKSEFSRSQSSREGGYETQGLSEQAVPLVSKTRIKQMQDWEVIIRHHNLPPFWARRMNWREHPILRERQALRPQEPPPLPPLTLIELRHLQPLASDELINPDARYTKN